MNKLEYPGYVWTGKELIRCEAVQRVTLLIVGPVVTEGAPTSTYSVAVSPEEWRAALPASKPETKIKPPYISCCVMLTHDEKHGQQSPTGTYLIGRDAVRFVNDLFGWNLDPWGNNE